MTGPVRNPWLPRSPSPSATARVFCLPYSGTGAGLYRNWPRERDGVDFLPIELPGHESRFAEPPAATYQELAKAMADGLRRWLDVPYAFFGHCWSANLAYEATLELASGPAPVRLFSSSQVAPQEGPYGRMLAMDDTELAAEMTEMIINLGGVPQHDFVELYTEVLRADLEIIRRYVRPDPPRVPCPITAIGWTEDTEVTPGQMKGWTACGETTFTVLDGRHMTFAEAPAALIDLLATIRTGGLSESTATAVVPDGRESGRHDET